MFLFTSSGYVTVVKVRTISRTERVCMKHVVIFSDLPDNEANPKAATKHIVLIEESKALKRDTTKTHIAKTIIRIAVMPRFWECFT